MGDVGQPGEGSDACALRSGVHCAGMGDVVSLVEKLQTGVQEDEARIMGERMMANKFDFNDFLKQIRFMSKLGGLTGLVKMMPGTSVAFCA